MSEDERTISERIDDSLVTAVGAVCDMRESDKIPYEDGERLLLCAVLMEINETQEKILAVLEQIRNKL